MLISRTDSIGDVVLTLPMAGLIKKHYPSCRVVFLGNAYTQPVVALSHFVDGFMDYTQLAAKPLLEGVSELKQIGADVVLHVFPVREIARVAFLAGIPHRVGTRSRWYHFVYCNHRLWLPRKRSNLHEAQLDMKLLRPLGISHWLSLQEIPAYYGFTRVQKLEPAFESLLDKQKVNVILHPRSKGSAVEWGLENFSRLISLLPASRFRVFVSGTANDRETMIDFLKSLPPHAVDICGMMNLHQFIAFIQSCDALVAASTGPLHIAAALGKRAIGLYSSRRPLFPKRWAPVGVRARALSVENCEHCRKGVPCDCIKDIKPEAVASILHERL